MGEPKGHAISQGGGVLIIHLDAPGAYLLVLPTLTKYINCDILFSMSQRVTEVTATCPNCGFPLVSAEEAARIIGVSYARVRAILARRPERLRAFKVGRAWVVPEQAAREFRPLPPHRPPKEEG